MPRVLCYPLLFPCLVLLRMILFADITKASLYVIHFELPFSLSSFDSVSIHLFAIWMLLWLSLIYVVLLKDYISLEVGYSYSWHLNIFYSVKLDFGISYWSLCSQSGFFIYPPVLLHIDMCLGCSWNHLLVNT